MGNLNGKGSGMRYLAWGQDVLSKELWQLVVPLCKIVGKVRIGIAPLQAGACTAELLLKPPQLVKLVIPVFPSLRKAYMSSNTVHKSFWQPALQQSIRNVEHRLAPLVNICRVWSKIHFQKLPSTSHDTPHYHSRRVAFVCLQA